MRTEGNQSGLVDPNGRPLGESQEQRIVREFHQLCNSTNSAFNHIGSSRVALGFTLPNREQAKMAMAAVQRWSSVISVLQKFEEIAVSKIQRADAMHDTEIGSEAMAFNESASMLRNALFGTLIQPDGKWE
jgi:hypothetical protein